MSALRRLLPDGMAGRFALLLAGALIAANLVALALLSLERVRADREARAAREIERIVSLVPAIEAVAPHARQAIAQKASTRASRLRIRPEPLVPAPPDGPRSRALTEQLTEALPGRTVHAAIRGRRPDGRPDWLDEDRRQGDRGEEDRGEAADGHGGDLRRARARRRPASARRGRWGRSRRPGARPA